MQKEGVKVLLYRILTQMPTPSAMFAEMRQQGGIDS